MVEDWLRRITREARAGLCDAIIAVFSALSQTLFFFYDWCYAHEWAIRSTQDNTRYWWYQWPLSEVVPWVIDRLNDLAGMVTHFSRTLSEWLWGWINRQYNPDWGWPQLAVSCWWAFWNIEELAGSVGYHIDHWVGELYDRVWALMDQVLDPLGRGIGEAERRVRLGPEKDYNYWGYCRAVTPNVWEAFQLMCSMFGQSLLDRFEAIGWGLLEHVLDPIGYGMCEIICAFYGWDTNIWEALKQSTPNVWEAFLSACRTLKQLLWAQIRNVDNYLWGWITPSIDRLRDDLDNLRNELREFRDDPAGYIWKTLSSTLLKRLENFLNEHWDIPV